MIVADKRALAFQSGRAARTLASQSLATAQALWSGRQQHKQELFACPIDRRKCLGCPKSGGCTGALNAPSHAHDLTFPRRVKRLHLKHGPDRAQKIHSCRAWHDAVPTACTCGATPTPSAQPRTHSTPTHVPGGARPRPANASPSHNSWGTRLASAPTPCSAAGSICSSTVPPAAHHARARAAAWAWGSTSSSTLMLKIRVGTGGGGRVSRVLLAMMAWGFGG